MQYRQLGRTGERLSVIGFGGMLVKGESQAEADRRVASAVDRGVNYFDISPMYGDAEERLGPALKPHRHRVFLACKTRQRSAAGAEQELTRSLTRLQTDHVDLYQLHSMAEKAEVEQVFAPEGAMELFLRARQEGKIRYIGFSAHSADAAVELLKRFPFASVLLPLNFCSYLKGNFGPQVVKVAQQMGVGLLALKAMARTARLEGTRQEETRWSKCWYEPLDDERTAVLALRFTLSLPITAALTPGHPEFWEIALREAQNPGPLTQEEENLLRELAARIEPLFSAATA